MNIPMKNALKKILGLLGLEIHRTKNNHRLLPQAGSTKRPIGDVRMFLEDVRARGFRPRGIIDVGANKGEWTREALSVFPGVGVIMIEPQKEMNIPLQRVCNEYPGIEHIQAGVAREQGVLVQTIWDDLAGSSFLPEIYGETAHKKEQRATPVLTIDGILKERNGFIPDLVKLDIQGFEIEALRGAGSLFGKTQLFIIETSLYEFLPSMPTTFECIKFMFENGYDIYDITGFLRRPLDGALGQIDLAFALRNGTLMNSNKWDAFE